MTSQVVSSAKLGSNKNKLESLFGRHCIHRVVIKNALEVKIFCINLPKVKITIDIFDKIFSNHTFIKHSEH